MTSPSARPGAEADPVLDDLVRRAQQGELPAFNAIVLRFQDAVYSLVLRMLTHPEPAEDVTQEAFVAACADGSNRLETTTARTAAAFMQRGGA